MAKPRASSRGSSTRQRDDHGRPSARDRFWSVFSPTTEPPSSALNLRLVLAVFGLIFCGVFAVVALAVGLTVLGVGLAALALIAVIDMAVVIRLRARRRDGHSLFE